MMIEGLNISHSFDFIVTSLSDFYALSSTLTWLKFAKPVFFLRLQWYLVIIYQHSYNSCSHFCEGCNCCQLLSFGQYTRVERKLSYELSLVYSHVTLVLVWLEHESWENSYTNSCLSSLVSRVMQLLLSFYHKRVTTSFMQIHAYIPCHHLYS